MKESKKMCLYCAKWHPEKELWVLLGEHYCSKCYPEVYDNVKNLPWNRGKPCAEWI